MDSILDKQIVLVCNRHWQAFEWRTPRQALVSMCGGMDGGTPPFLAMDITLDDDGKLLNATPTKWDDWVKLPVRPNDLVLTSKQGPFRCPLVLVTPVYAKMPVKGSKFNSDAVRRRDGDTCQVSGRKLSKGQGNLGHLIARAKGGKKTFDNIVWMDRELNTLQGTKTVEEMGWKLLKEPVAPMPVPATFLIDAERHRQQQPFITK